MGDHHDDHGDHPMHQAPWVASLTIAVCFAFTFFMIGLKLAL